MKQQPQYVDPEILKKKNAPTDEMPLVNGAAEIPVMPIEPLPEHPSSEFLQIHQPHGGVAEPLEELAEEMYPHDPVAKHQPAKEEPAQNQPKPHSAKNLEEQPEKSPAPSKKEVFGSKKQMENDIQYTSSMKKHKDIGKDEAEAKVDSISDRADNLLIKMKTVFPFDFFPSTITVDANKVSIVDKTFFASETITQILLEEITDIVVQSNFFLAQLVITYSHHPLQPLTYKIPTLRKKEALKAQEIIQGLLVLRIAEGIDLSKLKPDEITKELANIGKSHENIPSL